MKLDTSTVTASGYSVYIGSQVTPEDNCIAFNAKEYIVNPGESERGGSRNFAATGTNLITGEKDSVIINIKE